MVYVSLACISVAMISAIESFATIKGERFRLHLQIPEVRNRKFSLSYFTEINIKGRSWSPSNCPFGELGKNWEATKYKWLTFEKKLYFCRKQARQTFRPARFLELNFTARPVRAGPTGRPARADLLSICVIPHGGRYNSIYRPPWIPSAQYWRKLPLGRPR